MTISPVLGMSVDEKVLLRANVELETIAILENISRAVGHT